MTLTTCTTAQFARIPIGAKFGRLTVIGVSTAERLGKTTTVFRCKCTCGNYVRKAAHHLRVMVSCGCARGGITRGVKRDTAPYPWTEAQVADLEQLWHAGNNQAQIAAVLAVPYNAVQKKVAEMCLEREKIVRVAAMPAGVVFEDMPAAVLAREPRGRVPRAEARYSLTGCSAAEACS